MKSLLIKLKYDIEHSSSADKREAAYSQVLHFRKNLPGNQFDDLGLTALHWAISANRPVNEIQDLITQFPDLLDKNSDIQTADKSLSPLYIAAKNNNVEMVQLLLSRGAKYQDAHVLREVRSASSMTIPVSLGAPFDVAVKNKSNELINLLFRPALQYYVSIRRNENDEYHCAASKFFGGYSRTQKLCAADTLQKATMGEIQDWAWTEVMALGQTQPALKQGRLGKIYNALLTAIPSQTEELRPLIK